jgi:predicted outer membrane repeat protein
MFPTIFAKQQRLGKITSSPRAAYRPRLEALEDRTVLSTWAVTTSIDDITVPGTLRYAVAHAVSGDSILITGAVKDTPIVLTNGELILNQNVTIRGVGNVAETISGGGTTRLFEIGAGAHVTLSNLTLTGGNGIADNPNGTLFLDGVGGAILDLGTLTINASTVSGNSAIEGGAIFAFFGANLTINGITLTTNSAGDSGGAVLSLGTLTVSGSTFSGNTASTAGGAIFNVFSGTMTIRSCVFTANSAGIDGGAMENDGIAAVTGCTFSGNSAAFLGGGAIDNSVGAVLTVSNCTFSRNSAGFDGGAIDNEGFNSLTVSGSTFSCNTAVFGGAIFNDFAGTLSVSGSTFTSNAAGTDGGGIFNYFGAVNLATSVFCMNTPDNVVGGFNDLGGNTYC